MERIKFREVSDLSKILQKSAQFIRENFVAIMKSSALIVLIPFAIGAILTGISLSGFYSDLGSNMNSPDQFLDPFSSFKLMIPGYLLTTIAFLLFYIICIAYIKQYVNGAEVIEHNSIMDEVKKHILKVFFGGILLVMITYLGMFFCLVPGIYFAIVFSHVFTIAIVEGKGFGKSFSKSFNLIKGKWWDSFLLYFVSSLIVMGITFIMILPMYIYMFVGIFKNMDSNDPDLMLENMSNIGWFMPLYMVIYLLIILVTATIQSMNYYKLVEFHEGVGEKVEIESIGN